MKMASRNRFTEDHQHQMQYNGAHAEWRGPVLGHITTMDTGGVTSLPWVCVMKSTVYTLCT